MDGTAFWLTATLAAVLVGMSKGGLPVVGVLGVPVLSLVISPVTAAGLLLPVFVLSDLFGPWAYRRDFDRRVLAIMLPALTLGVGVGWATAHVIPEAEVRILVGLIGGAFALNILLRRGPVGPPRPKAVAPGLFWGAIAGFASFVSHAGGPPYQVYVLPLRLPKIVFAGTTTIAFAFANAIKLLPYWALGQLNPDNLRVAVVLTIPAVIAVFVGLKIVRWLPETLFFKLVVWALLAVSIRLIWDGLAS
jgi:uncharacterized membrane protein YfcA